MALTDIDGQRLGDSVADKLGDRNLIINGAMQVAQRSTSPVAAVGYQSVDRWAISHSGTSGSVTQSQGSTGGPTGFSTYFRMTNSSTTTATNGYRQIYQYIEAQNVRQFGWNYTDPNSEITLSFKVRASVSQLYYGRLYTDDGAQQGFTFKISKPDGTAIDADTWTDVTVVVPGNANITIDNDNGVGLGVIFTPHYGTDLTDNSMTLNAWAAYNGAALSPDYATTWATTLNATFDVTAVQLEVGNTATPFQHRTYSDELQKCDRYCQVYRWPNLYENICFGGATAGGAQLDCILPLRNEMRTAPSTSDVVSAVAHFRVNDWRGHDEDANSLTFYSAGTSAVKIGATKPTANMTAGYMGYLNVSTSAGGNARWTFSAEL